MAARIGGTVLPRIVSEANDKQPASDHANVMIMPPLLYGIGLLAGIALQFVEASRIGGRAPLRWLAGAVLGRRRPVGCARVRARLQSHRAGPQPEHADPVDHHDGSLPLLAQPRLRLDHGHPAGDRPAARQRLDPARRDPRRAGHALRRGPPRRGLPRAQLRRGVPALQGGCAPLALSATRRPRTYRELPVSHRGRIGSLITGHGRWGWGSCGPVNCSSVLEGITLDTR